MNRTLFFFISSLVLASAFVACGSNVKLADVPVQDKSSSSKLAEDAAAAAALGGVAPVQIDATEGALAGPANTVKTIYFDFDSYVLKPEFQSVIEAHARDLTADTSRKIAIEGHTDERGGREYNLALGQKRAEAVRRALGLSGVTDSQVEAVSFGKEKPAASGFDESSAAKNRRAEIRYR